MEVARYQRRLSGPLLDRIDMLVNVGRPSREELEAGPLTDSAQARERVVEARERQRRRLEGSSALCNGELDARLIQARVRLSEDAQAVIGTAYSNGALSARGRHRVLRVAQTVADLAGHARVEGSDMLQALTLRQRGAVYPATV
jgi:magnesium chelatase family protein